MSEHIYRPSRKPKIILYTLAVVLVAAIGRGCYYSLTHQKEIQTESMGRTYEFAERDYKLGLYVRSLHRYNSFLTFAERLPHRDDRVVEAVSKIGRIYIFVNRKPDMAVNLLGRFVDSPHFNELENEELHEWIGVAKQAIEIKPPPEDLNDAEKIFEKAKEHFDLGLKNEANDADVFRENIELSERYLIDLINRFEEFSHKSEAFYMLGLIDEKITSRDRAAEHFYFKETVRLAPHSEVAKKAFDHLYKAFHSENTRDGVDSTPTEIENFLQEFKHLAD